ncbi:hypothetical protein F66182_9321 [Fusarium sp. NRRL 66182]|nr:hypothetical protein F66182_9321 [Fusarium sp. NRRL 66182]
MPASSSSSSSDSGPVYFWHETDPDLGYLSQLYHYPFRDDKDEKTIYKTAEHYMMHQKALLFGDQDTAQEILKTDSPRKAKSLGRKVKNFDNKTWNENRCRVARQGNILKFTRALAEEEIYMNTPHVPGEAIEGTLLEKLFSTGERELVEASPFDRIWGIGFKAADAEAARASWGENLLGKELMEVRRILRETDE